MDITPLIPEGRKIITGYGDGGFVINKQPLSGSIIILPDQVIPWQNATGGSAITLAMLDAVMHYEREIEILLIGCGATHTLLDFSVRHALKQRGISVDSMSTGAACRTFNVLLAEERKVAAALVAVA
jgi:uncharacterized protein